jgi:hypothetical protein
MGGAVSVPVTRVADCLSHDGLLPSVAAELELVKLPPCSLVTYGTEEVVCYHLLTSQHSTAIYLMPTVVCCTLLANQRAYQQHHCQWQLLQDQIQVNFKIRQILMIMVSVYEDTKYRASRGSCLPEFLNNGVGIF